jgi:hypothetical protein
MGAIKYMTDANGTITGIWIDLTAIKKSVKKKKELAELMEEIEDIVAIELGKGEKSVPYGEARKRIFGRKK